MNSWKNKDLLLFEDSPLEKAIYVKMSESLGFCVNAYSHPHQIEGLAFKHSPHFIITDIYFKGNKGNNEPLGLDLIRRLKQESPTATILALSSNPHVTLYTECCEAGAHHFVKKPIQTKEELALALTIALKNRTQNKVQDSFEFEMRDWLLRHPDVGCRIWGYFLSKTIPRF